MLDTTFSRPVGDIGNPETYDFPVVYHIVKNATIQRVVKESDRTLLKPFIEGARELQQQGVRAITTSCGFLALFQKEIQSQLEVPFFSSSLIQIPLLHSLTGGRIGVLTARSSSLGIKHFQGVDAHQIPVSVQGMDGMPAFTNAIVDENAELNMHKVALEIKQCIVQLVKNSPDLTAIVLECTNMPPYRSAIREATDLPVFDINTLIHYVYSSI